jgi:hypothetical protein
VEQDEPGARFMPTYWRRVVGKSSDTALDVQYFYTLKGPLARESSLQEFLMVGPLHVPLP